MIFNPQIHLCSLCHSPTFKASESCRMLVLVLQQLGLWEAVRQPGQPAGWVRVGVWILWPRVQCSSRYSLLLPACSSRVSNQGRKSQAVVLPLAWFLKYCLFQLMRAVSRVVLNRKTKCGVPLFVPFREYSIWYYLNWRVIRLTGHAEKWQQGFRYGNKIHIGRNLAFGKEQLEFLPSATLIFFTLNQNHKATPAQSRWNMETSVKRTGQRGPVTQRLATGVSLLGSRTSWKVPRCTS